MSTLMSEQKQTFFKLKTAVASDSLKCVKHHMSVKNIKINIKYNIYRRIIFNLAIISNIIIISLYLPFV